MFISYDCRNDASMPVEPIPHPKIDTSHEGMTESSEDIPFNGTREKVDLEIQNILLLKSLNPFVSLLFFVFMLVFIRLLEVIIF